MNLKKLTGLAKQIAILIILTVFLMMPYFIFANIGHAESSPMINRLENVAVGSGGAYKASDVSSLATIMGVIVSGAISLLGIIFIILIILSGYQWMTAGGNEEAVKKSRTKMVNAVIGLLVVVASYAIWAFISNVLIK